MGTLVQQEQSLAVRVEAVIGPPDDPIELVDARAATLLPEYQTIVWEADAGSLECTFISESAASILGYPREDWTGRAGFWVEMIHPEDRDEAIANCALCAGRGRGHNFAYRAFDAQGNVHRFYNVLRVIRGPKRLAIKLRGILFLTDSDGLSDDLNPLMQIGIQEVPETIEY